MQLGLIIVLAVVAIIIFLAFFTVQQQTSAVIERFGKFVRIANPGLNMKIPVIEQISGRLNMRVQQLDVPIETKTEDNVFLKTMVSVQFYVLQDKIYEAFYKLEQPEQQITSFVFDVVRAWVPKMRLDDVFEKKEEIAQAVKAELTEIMSNFGYGIVKTLVTDIDPDSKVKTAMNEINEAQRLRVAANERGEAEKILKVKQAEAEAEAAKLQGEGIANQRKAIIQGLKLSVAEFQEVVHGVDASGVMNLVLLTQYFDTMKDLSKNSQTNTVLMPHSPNSVHNFMEQLRETMIVSDAVKKGS